MDHYKPAIERLRSLSFSFQSLEVYVTVGCLDWHCLAKVGSSEKHVELPVPRVYLAYLVET